jgi:hypothetical protein
MKFKFNPVKRHRSGLGMWRRYRTILILGSMIFTAHLVAVKTVATASTSGKPVQTMTSGSPAETLRERSETIALKSGIEPSPIDSSPADFRMLGYGLFLLQIGLIPLKLSKGNLIQTIDRN